MHERISWLAAATVALTACISHDQAAPAADDPEPEAAAMVAQEASPEARASTLVVASVAPHPDCAPFRDPDATVEQRRQRTDFLRGKLAVTNADDPALAESLLWLAEFQLGSGNLGDACKALDRLTAEVTDGEYAETGRCWFDHHCTPDASVACPSGFAADGPSGCEPVAACALDLDADIAAQVEGACDRGDAACCAKEGNLSMIYAHRARKGGDDDTERRHDEAANAAFEKSCAMGHAAVCAVLADRYERAIAAPADADEQAKAFRARACELGHVASCP